MTFFIGNEHRMIAAQKNTGLGFWTDDILLCSAHRRGLVLQPFLEADRKAGFGKLGCPFCKGGELEGKFHLYKSKAAVTRALDKLEKE